ncbi:hypothetical protein [Nocardioides sp.]|uniref:hypothetical protein n=1 Tax=Nocardioides sp. TaxID=35761 RepID=UPI002B267937|nr:hypothetical protein [Nocardioides sp.]
MHHLASRRPIVAVALLSLLVPLALLTPTTMSASTAADVVPPRHATALDPAPGLQVSSSPRPENPLEVSGPDGPYPPTSPEECVAAGGAPHSERCQDVILTINDTAPLEDVTVTVVESDDLFVVPMEATIGGPDSDETTSEEVAFVVQARTTGLHTLTFEVTAPGREPRSLTLPYVWRAGGRPLPGGDSLAGRLYGGTGSPTHNCAKEGGCTYRYAERLSFLDGDSVSKRLAVRGKQVCGPEGRCPTYRYDRTTGLVQIGRRMIGRVTGHAAYFDGFAYDRMAYPKRGQRLDGTWHFVADVDESLGIADQYLRLRDDGRFRLTYVVDTHRHPSPPDAETRYGHKRLGTYRIGRHGRLRLNDGKHKSTEIATLALVTTPSGRPRAAARGVWLDVSVSPPDFGPHFIDGNRLDPVSPPTG